MSALVLVQNEVTAGGHYDFWDDVTGVRYNFPNQYRGKFAPGKKFVYYRGVRRASGRRGVPEYFGHGTIASITIDPETPENAAKREWTWFAQIIDYVPFPVPVVARQPDGFLENIPANFWGVGVRELPDEIYNRILALAGLSNLVPEPEATDIWRPGFSSG